MNAALNGTDPVVFFESQRIYDMGEQFHEGRRARRNTMRSRSASLDVKTSGSDVTILTDRRYAVPCYRGRGDLEGEIRHFR